MTVKVRTRFQPCHEIEVSEQEAAGLKHEGLLWDGTDEELAALHEVAQLPAPAKAAKAASGTTVTASVAAAETKKKEEA